MLAISRSIRFPFYLQVIRVNSYWKSEKGQSTELIIFLLRLKVNCLEVGAPTFAKLYKNRTDRDPRSPSQNLSASL